MMFSGGRGDCEHGCVDKSFQASLGQKEKIQGARRRLHLKLVPKLEPVQKKKKKIKKKKKKKKK